MTIDILFMAENQLVLRINMSFSNFENKILDVLSDIEKEKWVPIFDDDKMLTNIEFIGKVWHACVSYGYNVMGKFLDQMKVSL